jgi:tetratricopeptide (TPR) repeat protein
VARVDRRRAQREARNARAAGRRRSGRGRGGPRPRGTPAGAVENQLFFTRLRTQAKWAFALMVVVFVVGFAFLGVGSGGLDLQSLVQDVFGAKGGGGGTSISKAQADVQKHPREPAAWKQLATAYQNKGQIDQAITALTQYAALRPKDATQLQQLAQLEKTQADNAATDYQLAYLAQQSSGAGSTFGPSSSSKLGQALVDPISSAVSTRDSTHVQQALTKYQTASTRALATYKRLAKLQGGQAASFQLAQAAEHFGDAKTAIAAYTRVLHLSSDPSTKAQIRAKIRSLRTSSANAGG